jgi:hypothetical protein
MVFADTGRMSYAVLKLRKAGYHPPYAHDCYHPCMAKLLLNLRNVPDDEADDVRALLDEHDIAYYETSPGFWNISLGGIWVREDAAFAEAKRLMGDYQAQRGARVRAENEAARRDGTAGTFWTVLRNEPLRVLVAVFGILFAIALVVLPALVLMR